MRTKATVLPSVGRWRLLALLTAFWVSCCLGDTRLVHEGLGGGGGSSWGYSLLPSTFPLSWDEARTACEVLPGSMLARVEAGEAEAAVGEYLRRVEATGPVWLANRQTLPEVLEEEQRETRGVGEDALEEGVMTGELTVGGDVAVTLRCAVYTRGQGITHELCSARTVSAALCVQRQSSPRPLTKECPPSSRRPWVLVDWQESSQGSQVQVTGLLPCHHHHHHLLGTTTCLAKGGWGPLVCPAETLPPKHRRGQHRQHRGHHGHRAALRRPPGHAGDRPRIAKKVDLGFYLADGARVKRYAGLNLDEIESIMKNFRPNKGRSEQPAKGRMDLEEESEDAQNRIDGSGITVQVGPIIVEDRPNLGETSTDGANHTSHAVITALNTHMDEGYPAETTPTPSPSSPSQHPIIFPDDDITPNLSTERGMDEGLSMTQHDHEPEDETKETLSSPGGNLEDPSRITFPSTKTESPANTQMEMTPTSNMETGIDQDSIPEKVPRDDLPLEDKNITGDNRNEDQMNDTSTAITTPDNDNNKDIKTENSDDMLEDPSVNEIPEGPELDKNTKKNTPKDVGDPEMSSDSEIPSDVLMPTTSNMALSTPVTNPPDMSTNPESDKIETDSDSTEPSRENTSVGDGKEENSDSDKQNGMETDETMENNSDMNKQTEMETMEPMEQNNSDMNKQTEMETNEPMEQNNSDMEKEKEMETDEVMEQNNSDTDIENEMPTIPENGTDSKDETELETKEENDSNQLPQVQEASRGALITQIIKGIFG